jgi:hypothetical protein
MLYTGIDYHKRYSVVCTVDAEGQRVQSTRIDQKEPTVFGVILGGFVASCGPVLKPKPPHIALLFTTFPKTSERSCSVSLRPLLQTSRADLRR